MGRRMKGRSRGGHDAQGGERGVGREKGRDGIVVGKGFLDDPRTSSSGVAEEVDTKSSFFVGVLHDDRLALDPRRHCDLSSRGFLEEGPLVLHSVALSLWTEETVVRSQSAVQ